jgi:hypothetical protein
MHFKHASRTPESESPTFKPTTGMTVFAVMTLIPILDTSTPT